MFLLRSKKKKKKNLHRGKKPIAPPHVSSGPPLTVWAQLAVAMRVACSSMINVGKTASSRVFKRGLKLYHPIGTIGGCSGVPWVFPPRENNNNNSAGYYKIISSSRVLFGGTTTKEYAYTVHSPTYSSLYSIYTQ